MTALGIRYLTGCAVSSDMTRQAQEFPQHWGRVFMALAAAHLETKGGAEERQALEWLEGINLAPSISAPGYFPRIPSAGRTLETFVPVNDKLQKEPGVMWRSRQARSFPTARLHSDTVFLLWDIDAPDEIRTALDRLCGKVTRIGHSSSLVQMWVAERPHEIKPNLIPDNGLSQRRMRIAEPGTLAHLEKAFAKGERPRLNRWHGYREAGTEAKAPAIQGVFAPELIIFEKFEGRNLGLEATMQLTSALRNAAMKTFPNGECPEWLSGHQPEGKPSLKPHVAFFPLAFVDSEYADGHVMGLALAIPRGVPDIEARRALGPLLFNPESGEEREIHLWRNDGLWDWHLRRETRDFPQIGLRGRTWTEPSCVWASVTPVVLHHHPKKNRGGDVERIVAEAFVSAGFPKPVELYIRPSSLFEGAPDVRSMPEFSEGGGGLCTYQTHVVAVFESCLEGPLLVGRGRYRGYGLFRPVRARKERQ